MRDRGPVVFAPFGDGLADVTRSIAIAEAVRARGAATVFAGRGSVLSERAAAAGFDILDLPSPDISGLRAFQGEPPGEQMWVEAREQVAAEIELFGDLQPEIVVGDCRPTLRISTEVVGVPYAGIVGATWTPYFFGKRLSAPEALTPRWARMMPRPLLERAVASRVRSGDADPGLERWNQLATDHGATPVADGTQLFRGELGLVTDVRELVPAEQFPPELPFVGPLVWGGVGSVPEVARTARRAPLVYATFGSTGPDWVIPALLEALATLPLQAVFSVGPHIDPASLDAAPNVHIEQVVPGSAMARLADVVICHGGIGSLYQAAAGGTPIVGIPGHFEQQWNVDLFARWGCAVRLPGHGLRARTIREALTRVLDEPRFTERARDLQQVMARYDAPATAADLLLHAVERAAVG